jgi:hypothetical protein
MSTALEAWLDQWAALTAAAGEIAGKLRQLAAAPPGPICAEDAAALLAWRERATAGRVDGPAGVEALQEE